MKWINAFCLICIFLCVSFFPDKVSAQKDGSELLENGNYLFRQGNYFEAGIAYERAYFFASDSRLRMEANLGRAQALKQTGEFLKARNDLQRTLHLRQFPELHFRLIYELAFCEYMLGNYSTASGTLLQLKHFYPEEYFSNEILTLHALAGVMAEDFSLAQEKTLELIILKGHEENITDSLVKRTMILFCECSAPVLRSEKTAARWSTFIPGAGHLYAGYPGKSLLNAGSQLVSLGLAAYMGWNNLYVSGFVVGLGMFQSFYFGGIRQAAFLANQRNISEMASYKEMLKEFILNLNEDRKNY
jgi:tetratricopeptide (TPR) repeat protein